MRTSYEMPSPSRPKVHILAKLATHWSPVGTMQRMVCRTPRAMELANVDGRVEFVVVVLVGVTETVDAEVVVNALRVVSVVLWSVGPSVNVLMPEDMLALSVAELTPGETLGLSVTMVEGTSELVEKSEPVIVMDAVTVSVTVIAGHVLSVP